MKNVSLICLICLLLVPAAAEPKALWDFTAPPAEGLVAAADARFTVTGGAMTVSTGHQHNWPGVTLNAPDKTWDLSAFRRVAVDVENLSGEPIKVHLRIDDPRADGGKYCLTGSAEIAPGQTVPVKTELSPTPWVLSEPLELVGMRGYPQSVDALDASRICRVILFLNKPEKDYSFRLRNLRAEGSVTKLDSKTFLPFIDPFGQFIHADWPGKIHSEKDFVSVRGAEQKALLDQPGPADWDQYGGWAGGPQLKASGFFRVEKVDGQWWLIDPEGHLFWSHGTDCVRIESATPVTGRENYFAWLPDKDSPFAGCLGQGSWAPHGWYKDKGVHKTFDFAHSNLIRKFGGDFKAPYALLCHQRLRSWGMNTIGNWSDPEIYMQRKTPYVTTISFSSRPIEGSEGYWGQFDDVFDPGFRQAVKQRLESEKGKTLGDPWCIGIFVQNELAWGSDTSLSMAALQSPPDQPAKIKFVEVLKARYGEIEKLNEAWAAHYASWEALLQSKTKPDAQKARPDLTAFYTAIAETYFQTIRDEIKAAAPEMLYLGCRFAWVNDLAAIASAKYCDVVSYNRYERSVANLQMPGQIDKPLIIGEFHFGALDRGMFHTGLVPCDTQADRAEAYREYVLGALRNPNLVGTHWFQFRDQATTGRGDGENYQIGLLDIADTPYPETIGAVREVGGTLYEYRFTTSKAK